MKNSKRKAGVKVNKMLYNSEIEDELMIQFIIMYALNNADEALSYTELLNIVQGNCEISFTDLQLSLDNLITTEHVKMQKISDILSVYDVTDKGKYVIDFFYKQIPLIIREPIDKSIKELYLDKRRKEAVKSYIVPMNDKEYYTECRLKDDDKTLMLSISLYAGERKEAERLAEHFKSHSSEIYNVILKAFSEEDKKTDEDA